EDGIRDFHVTGVQTCALPISYMQLMGDCPTFTTEQELEAAIALRKARSERWAALLNYPPLVPSLRVSIGQRIELDAEHRELLVRSEERRVGKEGRPRRGTKQW